MAGRTRKADLQIAPNKTSQVRNARPRDTLIESVLLFEDSPESVSRSPYPSLVHNWYTKRVFWASSSLLTLDESGTSGLGSSLALGTNRDCGAAILSYGDCGGYQAASRNSIPSPSIACLKSRIVAGVICAFGSGSPSGSASQLAYSRS